MPAAHDLIQDLPEFRKRLEAPDNDRQLTQLLKEYHDLDQQALELEKDDRNTSSEALEHARKARLLVKDKIERHLRYGA